MRMLLSSGRPAEYTGELGRQRRARLVERRLEAGRTGIEPATLGIRMCSGVSNSLASARAFSGILAWVNH